MQWNVQGWTKGNEYLRKMIIECVKPDILCINETFLKGNSSIQMDKYEFIDHKRKNIHRNAKRGSGGIGMFIDKTMYTNWVVEVCDKSFEGILIVRFKHKHTSHEMIIICCYLPPENSKHGRNGSEFYAYLLQKVYQYRDVDSLYICGDLNSRIITENDFIPEIDDIPNRTPLDIHGNVNGHGECMIDFLLDSKMCITNGRITPQYDDFTYISSLGKSVIDYFIIPHDHIDKCIEQRVLTMRKLIDDNKLQDKILDAKHIPDHSIVSLKVKFTNVEMDVKEEQAVTTLQQGMTKCISKIEQQYPYFYKKYKRDLPNDWERNICHEFLNQINEALNRRLAQDEVDKLYNDFCHEYHTAMDIHLRYVNTLPGSLKKYRSKPKPWWNEDLDNAWKQLVIEEKSLKNKNKNVKLNKKLCKNISSFKKAQQNFDKLYRKSKRQYFKEKQNFLEYVNTKNPREFWSQIKKIGPNKHERIPFETYRSDGTLTDDTDEVLSIWKEKYETLYCTDNDNHENYDKAFYQEILVEKELLEHNSENDNNNDDDINIDIAYNEVRNIVMSSKNGKAIGLDNLPYEIFKNVKSITILHKLFNIIFKSRVIPSMWLKAIIKPIPKSSMNDPRVPLQYRGISLLSTVSKLFTGILNKRLSNYAEKHDLFVEEQNGFRTNRSCEEHIFTLTSIIRNRKTKGKETFVGFVDMEKAFDKVDRNLLLYMLLKKGISGNMYSAIKAMYETNNYTIGLNNVFTPWFNADIGVRQGDCLSSTLFAMFINDMAKNVKALNNGILIEGNNVCILLFADDIAIITDNEENLQNMFNEIQKWCFKWRLNVNCNKTKVVHFRPASKTRTNYQFKYNGMVLEIVEQYKYLGIVLNEFLDFKCTAKVLASAAGRALGKLWNVYKGFNGLNYKSYTKLYETYVDPILLYCSSVWGANEISYCNSIQNRAIRWYLGVHKFTPNLAIMGDIGWKSSKIKRQKCIIRLWNRIINMDDNRLPKLIFEWDYKCGYQSWTYCVKNMLSDIGFDYLYFTKDLLDCKVIEDSLFNSYKNDWMIAIQNSDKLRTYVNFKYDYYTEPYVFNIKNKSLRSMMAQFRCGVLPIKIETGRFENKAIYDRKCEMCEMDSIEDEHHFLLECTQYNNERQKLYEKAKESYPEFMTIENDVKMVILVNDEDLIKDTAQYISNSYQKRAKLMNK